MSDQANQRGRRICWPDPDATCLESGCGWCWDEPMRSWASIARYARSAGQVPSRFGGGTKDACDAFAYGARHLGAPPGYHAPRRDG